MNLSWFLRRPGSRSRAGNIRSLGEVHSRPQTSLAASEPLHMVFLLPEMPFLISVGKLLLILQNPAQTFPICATFPESSGRW